MKILAADDDPLTLRLLGSHLKRWGYDIITAKDGLEALSIAMGEDPPEIMLLDWEMPGMDGIEVCERLRADPDRRHAYIIMITSRSKKDDMIKGFSSGVDDYIKKPVDSQELRARINVGERIVGLESELRKKASDADLKFRSLFENSPEGILHLEEVPGRIDNAITDVNSVLCSMLDRDREGIVGSRLEDLVHPNDHLKVRALLEGDVHEGIPSAELRLLKSGGDPIWAAIQSHPLSGIESETARVCLIRDITSIKKEQGDILKKLMKYRLEEGNLYLVLERTLETGRDALNEALKVGYAATLISRTPEKDLRKAIKGDIKHFWMAQTQVDGSIRADPEAIIDTVKRQPNHGVFHIDRLDFIHSAIGFKGLMALISSLKEAMVLKDSMAIVTLDPDTIDARESALLSKECSVLEPLIRARIDEELMDILKLLYERERRYLETSLSNMVDDLKISRPTARKRVSRLLAFDYIVERWKGRERLLGLTDRGRAVFM